MIEPVCDIHKYHRPSILVETDHHVIPQSWCLAAGQPIDPVTIGVGATCHDNVHYAIDLLVRYQGKPPWDLWQHVGSAERDWAEEGYNRALALGLTPKPTL
jgi:hypothetical protein